MSAYDTVGQLIKAAYANLGIVEAGNDLSPELYEQGRQSLNAMLGAWSKKRLVINGIVSESFPLVVGQSVYTIGVGGNFNTAWPFSILAAYIRDANGIDYSVNIITREQYNSISVKSVDGRPEYLFYDPQHPIGVIRFFYVPDDNTDTIYLDCQKVITSFASIDDAITLPPEYEEAIEYNLSMRLSPKINVPATREVAALASSSYGVINMQPVEPAKFDGSFGTRAVYNIYSDNI